MSPPLLMLLNWIAAGVIALGLSAAWLLDLPSEAQALIDSARAGQDAMEQAEQQAQQKTRFNKAAQAVCGQNAAWADLGYGSVQCRTKRGHKTIVAKVAP